jgi:hypothetical protein
MATDLYRLFPTLHKRAFGAAIGVASSVLVASATVMHLLRAPTPPFPLELLGQFFAGYTVSWMGAVIGAFWAFVAGFAAGWFIAFTRNLTLAIMLFAIRTREELQQTDDFLDHI